MAHLTKKALLEQIRERLNSQAFIGTSDHESDVIHAANETLRENGYDPSVDFHPAPSEPVRDGVIVPSWANGKAPKRTGELGDIIADFTTRYNPVVSGNRVSKTTWLASRVVTVNAQEPTPDVAVIKFEKRSYAVPTHTAHPYKRRKEPVWSRSELDMMLFARNMEAYREMYPLPIVRPSWLESRYRADGMPVTGGFAEPDGRTVRSIARSRRDVYSQMDADRKVADMLKANRDAIRRENPPVSPVHPSVKPGNIGLAGLAYRPHGKWFTRVPVPVAL